MASKNSIKVDVKNGFYHVYNRGVEKRTIFEDKQDYEVFLKYLKEYLLPQPDKNSLKHSFTVKDTIFKGVPRQPKNYNKKIEIVTYCLMPNHIHFLLKQRSKGSLRKFMQSLLIRYGMYFNKSYHRIGPLFQGRYKAILIDNDDYLLHLSRYIHLNPSKNHTNLTKAYSSYADYLKLRKTPWVHPSIITNIFNNSVIPEIRKFNGYQTFVENFEGITDDILGDFILD